jgi:hypothetical protein
MKGILVGGIAVALTMALAGSLAAQSSSPAPSTAGAFAHVHSVPGGNPCTTTSEEWPLLMECVEQNSDPRVSGPATRTLYLGPVSPTDSLDGLFWWDVVIHGPAGDWTGPGYGVRDTRGIVHGVEMLTGHGGYEGLVYATWWAISMDLVGASSGFIAEGSVAPSLPVVPVPAASPAP